MALTRLNNQALPAGSVLQVQSAHNTTEKAITAAHTSDGEASGLSISITPTSATSKFLILVKLSMSNPNGNYIGFRLRRGSTEIGSGSGKTYNGHTIQYFNSQNGGDSSSINTPMGMFEDDPDTSSAITYSVYAFVSGGTGYINRRTSVDDTNVTSSMTVMEIAG